MVDRSKKTESEQVEESTVEDEPNTDDAAEEVNPEEESMVDIKIPTKDLIASGESLDILMKQALQPDVTFRLGIIRRSIKPLVEAFNEARNAQIASFGDMGEDGRPTVKKSTPQMVLFEDAMDKIGDKTVEFQSYEIKISELIPPMDLDGVRPKPFLTGEICADLYWLIIQG